LALKKLNVQPIGHVDEVNMFLDDSSNVIHFQAPRGKPTHPILSTLSHLLKTRLTDSTVYWLRVYIVHAAVGSNTYAIYGQAQTKDLTELVPQGILNQLGPDAMAQLKRLAEQIQQQQGGAAQGGQGIEEGAEADDEEVPELVEATPTAEGTTDEDKTEVSAHIESISLQIFR